MHGSLPGTLTGRPFKALVPVKRIRATSCRENQRQMRLTVCAQKQSEQDQVCMHQLCTESVHKDAPDGHMKGVLQAIQMSKRALLAGLASMAIIPLQATQVLALGNSKTVSISGQFSFLLLHTAVVCCGCSASMSVLLRLCRCSWLVPLVTQANEWCNSYQPKGSRFWQAPG